VIILKNNYVTEKIPSLKIRIFAIKIVDLNLKYIPLKKIDFARRKDWRIFLTRRFYLMVFLHILKVFSVSQRFVCLGMCLIQQGERI